MKHFSFFLFFSIHSFSLTILIDPGHGGYEVGAKTKVNKKEIFEKDLTLHFAKILKNRLQSQHKVFLTRDSDKFVSLEERALKADKVKADLVLSLHFNSSKDKAASGSEIFYLDNHKNKAVKKLESIENVGLEEKETSITHKILIDLAIKLTHHDSKRLAFKLNNLITPVLKKHGIKNRKVKPGLFYILALSKRPGLLLEPGFMSNPNELNKIKRTQYLEDYSQKILELLKE